MKNRRCEDLMVPLAEYAVIDEDATLYEATLALEKAQMDFDRARYRHRGILVRDKDGHIVGKIDQAAVLRALEPKYDQIQESHPGAVRGGLSRKFLKSLMETYRLFDRPMSDICRKAGQGKVSDFMRRPTEGEFVDAEATLDEAIHLLILGGHDSLLVGRKEAIIGVLRLTDVFAEVFDAMKQCNL